MLAVVTTRGLGAGAAGASLYVWVAGAGEVALAGLQAEAWGLEPRGEELEDRKIAPPRS